MARSRSRSRSRSRKGNAFTRLVKRVSKECPHLKGAELFKHCSKIYKGEKVDTCKGAKSRSRSRSRTRRSKSRSRRSRSRSRK